MDLRRTAVGLRKAAEDKLGITARIKTGTPGDFTVLVNGKQVFGYKQEGSMPPVPELLQRIQAAQS